MYTSRRSGATGLMVLFMCYALLDFLTHGVFLKIGA